MVTIKEIKNNQIDEFIKCSYEIYKDNPFWIPQLDRDVKNILSDKNPFWQHAKKALFLAYNDSGKVVGRIVGIIDYNYIKFQENEIGFFGFFECINDIEVAKQLFDSVKQYLEKNNLHKMMGPMNPSTNDEVGFLYEGFDSSPRIMMPYTHKYYINLAEQSGLKKIKELYAYEIPVALDDRTVRLNKALNIVKKRNPTIIIRTFSKKNFKRDLADVMEIYNSAWEKNWGFVPWTNEEFETIADSLVDLLDEKIVMMAYDGENPVGMLIAIPDYNFILKKLNGKLFPFGFLKFLYFKNKVKDLRLMIMGVKKEYRNKGIEAYMSGEALKNSVERGYNVCELSWILDDNIMTQRTAEMMSGRLYKRYAVYSNAGI